MLASCFFKILHIKDLIVASVRVVRPVPLIQKIIGATSLSGGATKCSSLKEEINKESKSPEYECPLGKPKKKPPKQNNCTKLSHLDLIRQGCMLTVNSASTLLTTTVASIIDNSMKYKDSLSAVLGIAKAILAQCDRDDDQQLYGSFTLAKLKISQIRKELDNVVTLMSEVEKMVSTVSEASFLVGADYLCTILCERLESAKKEVERNMCIIEELDRELQMLEQHIQCKREKMKANENCNAKSKMEM